MADARNRLERLEFRNDFRRAVHQLLLFVENALEDGQHRAMPDIREWRLQRAKTIGKLDELRALLDKTCVTASYGKGVGIGAELVGEVTTILGALMRLGESPSAETLINFGTLLNHSGSLLEGASNAAESFISAKYLMEIEEVLKRDQELSRPLQEWLTFSRNLDANVREVFGCDLNMAIQNNVLKVFSEFAMLHSRGNGFQESMDLLRRGSYATHVGSISVEILLRFSSELERYPELQGNIQTICSTLSNSTRVIQVVTEGVRGFRNLVGEEESSNTLVEGSSGALRQEPPTRMEVATFCAFQTIHFAVNLIHFTSVIMTATDGKSKYSDALQQISDLLDNELRSMEEL